jgi:ankyrin repeat protein
LEPHLLRAAENDDVERLREIVELAREKKQLNDNFLRIGLMRSSEKGKVGATQYLLSQGAQPDSVGTGNRLSPLLRAVERNHIAIVQLLLGHGANRETRDKVRLMLGGQTSLLTVCRIC